MLTIVFHLALDINLLNTTLRYSATNEVSTVSNSSLVASKIVNCGRSPNALIFLTIPLHISFLEDGMITAVQNAMKDYVEKNPRAWDRFIFIRREEIDANDEMVRVSFAFIHRNSWQDAPRILIHRGNLLKFIHETTEKLGIDYCSPASRRLIYSGGVLVDGQEGEGGYKARLLKASNIRSFDAKFDKASDFQSFATIQAQGTSKS